MVVRTIKDGVVVERTVNDNAVNNRRLTTRDLSIPVDQARLLPRLRGRAQHR